MKRALFIFFSIAMTSISVVAGFKLYEATLNLTFAFMISGIFEAARLLFLFLAVYARRLRLIGGILYIAVASICAAVAITSFYREINLGEIGATTELQRRAAEVAVKYSEKIEADIAAITQSDEYRRIVNNATWAKEGSRSKGAWLERKAIKDKDIKAIRTEAERNKLLARTDPSRFIALVAPTVSEVSKLTTKEERQNVNSQTLSELWGVTEGRAKKLLGIAITVIVELSIFFLALLSKIANGEQKRQTEIVMSPYDMEIDKKLKNNNIAKQKITRGKPKSQYKQVKPLEKMTRDEIIEYIKGKYRAYNVGETFLKRIAEINGDFKKSRLSLPQQRLYDELREAGIDVKGLVK